MKTNFIFDLDGTLIDSAHDIKKVLFDSMNKYGFNISYDTFLKVGPPLPNMVKSIISDISDDVLIKIVNDYRVVYRVDKLEKTVPFEGIVELLKYLESKEVNVFIATFKPKAGAMNILNRHFDGLYKDIITPTEIENFDNSKSKADILKFLMNKWNITADKSVMIGDAKTDIEGAREVGMTTIAALYGYGEEEEFVNADKKVTSVKELLGMIEDILLKI